MCIEAEEETEKPVRHTNGRCVYLKECNIIICPMGEILYPHSYKERNHYVLFYNRKVCLTCPCKCIKSEFKMHEISMKRKDYSKNFNDKNLNIKQIRYIPDKKLLKQRKCLSEYPFGVIKRAMGADYYLCKGFKNIIGETSLAFLVFNLKRAFTLLESKNLRKFLLKT